MDGTEIITKKIDQNLIKQSKSISKPKKEQSDSSDGDIALSQ